MAVSVDGAAKPGPGWTGVRHFLCGNGKNCCSGITVAKLVSRFAPWDAGGSWSFVRSWEEKDVSAWRRNCFIVTSGWVKGLLFRTNHGICGCTGDAQGVLLWWDRDRHHLSCSCSYGVVIVVCRSETCSTCHIKGLFCVCLTICFTVVIWFLEGCGYVKVIVCLFCTMSGLCPAEGFSGILGWRLVDNKHYWCCMHGNKSWSWWSNEGGLSGLNHSLATRYFLLVAQNAAASSQFPQWLQTRLPTLQGAAELFVVNAELKQPN